MLDRLRADLEDATAQLRAHMASWEYAFAMGSSCHGGSEHPVHWETRQRTQQLQARCLDLKSRVAEFQSGA